MVRLMLALEVLVLVGLVGCTHGPAPSSKRFYEGLTEPVESIDFSGLKDARIVIDPGHGGVFRGARGPSGLDEADVNLAVALRLGEMLREAGARVTLTRDSDLDFVGGDSLRLRDDLRARVEIANRADPDVFMSLHHNADLKHDPEFNEIQVYYRVWDDGPSLDAARAIATHLSRNLGEDKARVIGGNYHVLRNSVAPAVLCEPSFITNPRIEASLRSQDNLRIEAATYLIALADYFSRGVPRVVALGASGCSRADSPDTRPAIEVGFDAGTVIDPATVDLRLDGEALALAAVGANRFAALPADHLAGGLHLVSARARAVTGNASREAAAEFQIDIEPETLTLRVEPPVADGADPQRITALAFDRNRNPVADSTPVLFSWRSRGAAAASLTRFTRAGQAAIYAGRDLPYGATVAARCRSLETSVALEVTAPPQMGQPRAYVSGFVTDPEGRPVAGASVRGDHSGDFVGDTDDQGFFLLSCEPVPSRLAVFRRGFTRGRADLAPGEHPVVRLRRLYGALDPSRGVMIDAVPELPARRFNLAVARKLRDLLEAAGIRADLTTSGEEPVTDETRLKRAEAFGPAVLVSIASPAGADLQASPASVGHYPESAAGQAMAKLVAEEIELALGGEVNIAETADYMIQQPTCPAIRVELGADAPAGETGAEVPAAEVWRAAQALMCAVVRFLGVDRASTTSLAVRVTEGGRPAAACLVTLDGALEAVTDAAGEVTFAMIEAGPHILETLSASGAARSLELEPGADFAAVRLD
ncbi:MAG: N-acetylmuramoyl-L-alanine amidase [bacterium]